MLKASPAALAASLFLALAGQARAESATTQLGRCQETLAAVASRPLTTLEHYPDYLLQRLLQPVPSGDERGLAWCEETLWSQVEQNLEQQSALVSAACRRGERIASDYRALRTYYMGIPDLACDADWFAELSVQQWQRLQPMLAELNTLEIECYQGLEALARGGELRTAQARSLYTVVRLSRKVFERRWQSLLTTLENNPRQALEGRQQQLAQCETLLGERLDAH